VIIDAFSSATFLRIAGCFFLSRPLLLEAIFPSLRKELVMYVQAGFFFPLFRIPPPFPVFLRRNFINPFFPGSEPRVLPDSYRVFFWLLFSSCPVRPFPLSLERIVLFPDLRRRVFSPSEVQPPFPLRDATLLLCFSLNSSSGSPPPSFPE